MSHTLQIFRCQCCIFEINFEKKAVDEVNFLEINGITISTSSRKRKMKFRFVSLIGVNLAVHNVLEFAGSFSSNFSCRFCLIKKNQLSEVFSSSSYTLRTNESLEDYVLQSDPNSTGVFGPSASADASS